MHKVGFRFFCVVVLWLYILCLHEKIFIESKICVLLLIKLLKKYLKVKNKIIIC